MEGISFVRLCYARSRGRRCTPARPALRGSAGSALQPPTRCKTALSGRDSPEVGLLAEVMRCCSEPESRSQATRCSIVDCRHCWRCRHVGVSIELCSGGGGNLAQASFHRSRHSLSLASRSAWGRSFFLGCQAHPVCEQPCECVVGISAVHHMTMSRRSDVREFAAVSATMWHHGRCVASYGNSLHSGERVWQLGVASAGTR